LSSLKGYRVATPDDAGRLDLKSGLDPSEQLVGVYANPEGSKLAEIGVTTERLCLYSPGRPTEHVRFKDIKSTTLGEEATASRMITVTRYDGSSCNIEVAGGEGRFRDSMAFLQFIDRVVADLRRTG
jgi:hypothetical protein